MLGLMGRGFYCPDHSQYRNLALGYWALRLIEASRQIADRLRGAGTETVTAPAAAAGVHRSGPRGVDVVVASAHGICGDIVN